MDAVATKAQKAALGKLSGSDVVATELAGDPVTAKLTKAPGNGAAVGGLKVVTDHAWFAARPSGTEDVYKIYAESFAGRRPPEAGAGRGQRHRRRGPWPDSTRDRRPGIGSPTSAAACIGQ